MIPLHTHRTHTHIYIYIHVFIYTCVYIKIYVCIYIYIYIYIYIDICIYIYYILILYYIYSLYKIICIVLTRHCLHQVLLTLLRNTLFVYLNCFFILQMVVHNPLLNVPWKYLLVLSFPLKISTLWINNFESTLAFRLSNFMIYLNWWLMN